MALPTEKILLRSPYWITETDSTLSYILINLRVWLGTLAEEPLDTTIRLRSTALNGVASVDISELARDFVEVTLANTGEESNAVLISAVTTSVFLDGTATTAAKEYWLGLDGYGTFTDGANYSVDSRLYMSTEVIRSYSETNNRIPVLAETFTGYRLQRRSYTGYSDLSTVSGLTAASNTADAIDYVNTQIGGSYADRVVLEFSTGQDIIVDVEYAECNKYGFTPAFFVNRFGAVQQVHFTGKFSVSMASKDTKYTRNILQNGTYSKDRHQEYVLSKNGKISLELNTGWIPEEENDTYLELLMSEQVWLKVESNKFGVGFIPKQTDTYTLPVHLTSKSLNVKSKLNDKLINYNFKFEAANDWINSIR